MKDILAQITLGELGTFFAGLAAIITILWSIGMCAFKRWFCRLSVSVNSTVLRILRKSIEGQLDGRPPESYYTHGIHFTNGIVLHAPMIPNVELTIAENLTISVANHDSDCTTLALKSSGHSYLPPHFHPHTSELIEVRAGDVVHLETGRIYRSGETWFIPANEPHSAVFSTNFFGLVSCRPPLPTAKEVPVDLERMEMAFAAPKRIKQ